MVGIFIRIVILVVMSKIVVLSLPIQKTNVFIIKEEEVSNLILIIVDDKKVDHSTDL